MSRDRTTGYHGVEKGRSVPGCAGVDHGLFENLPITDFRHPLRTGKMAFPADARALSIGRIAMQHDPRHLRPVGLIRLGVEQAEIGDEMHFVIGRDLRHGRRQIIDIGVQFGPCCHPTALQQDSSQTYPKMG